jgi:EF-P beta-lysylation protein EpmB
MAILAPEVEVPGEAPCEASSAAVDSTSPALPPPLLLDPWQQAVRHAIRDPAELCRLLDLPAQTALAARSASDSFPLFVPRAFAAKIEPGNPRDPLLLQVLPHPDELATPDGYVADPVGDEAAQVVSGLLHKYTGRALLVTTGACAVHCRYCFRRHYPYDELPHATHQWENALTVLAADDSIHEVILSGGDPLMLVDHRLAWLANRLAGIRHIQRLRLHTRLPIMIPERVNASLLDWLTSTRLAPWVVVHANHPRELDRAVLAALSRLIDAGIPVMNQAVLLQGVNDDLDTLCQLCERLIDHRVLPYYLHQLDPVRGAAHFAVPESRGIELIAELAKRLPGYAVPRYVREQSGAPHKLSVA